MDPSKLSKDELKRELAKIGLNGPITDQTRPMLEKQLLKRMKQPKNPMEGYKVNKPPSRSPARKVVVAKRIPSPIETDNVMNNSQNFKNSSLTRRDMVDKRISTSLKKPLASPSRSVPNSDVLKQLKGLKELSQQDPITIPKEISFTTFSKPREPVFKPPQSYGINNAKNNISFDSTKDRNFVSTTPITRNGVITRRNLINQFESSEEYPGYERRRYVDREYGKNVEKSIERNRYIKETLKYLFMILFILCTLYIIWKSDVDVNRQKDILVTSFYETFSFILNYAIVPFVALGLLVILLTGSYLGIKYFRSKKLKETKRITETAEKIVGYLTSLNSKSDSVGVLENQLFDEIFPKMKRTKKDKKIFEKALDHVFETEISIRFEVHDYDGVETRVFFWTTPLREKWQGCAVGNSNGVNLPRHASANCLKIRGMSLKNVFGKDEEVMNDIRVRCIPYKIIDMQLMSDKKDIVLYMKLRNNEEASKVFHLLHSHWFNGDLLNCKLLEESKYNQRFNV
uniref:LEM domain-containing protein n=1 Tax=Parastrongyloides trichosuri TaxID=131310 RepID=A0A0N4Z9U5_PARTI